MKTYFSINQLGNFTIIAFSRNSQLEAALCTNKRKPRPNVEVG